MMTMPARRTAPSKGLFAFPGTGKGLDLRGKTPLAAVAVQTTGFSPGQGRIVELAIVRLDPAGKLVDEWSTVLDPGREVGPTFVHHVTQELVAGAPKFGDAAGEVTARIEGSLVVAHNAPFVEAFLDAELARAAVWNPALANLPSLPAVCTLALARETLPAQRCHRLPACGVAVGAGRESSRSALDDARMAGRVAVALLPRAGRLSWPTGPVELPHLAVLAESRRRNPPRVARGTGWLADVLDRIPDPTGEDDPPEAEAYLDAIAESLAAGTFGNEQARQLGFLAIHAGIAAPQLIDLHRRFLESLLQAVSVGGVVTPSELAELRTVAMLMGQPEAYHHTVAQERGAPPAPAPPPPEPVPAGRPEADDPGEPARGVLRIWCSPEVAPSVVADLRAASHQVLGSMSRHVDVVVCADPDSSEGSIAKARKWGKRIVRPGEIGELLRDRPPAPVPAPPAPGSERLLGPPDLTAPPEPAAPPPLPPPAAAPPGARPEGPPSGLPTSWASESPAPGPAGPPPVAAPPVAAPPSAPAPGGSSDGPKGFGPVAPRPERGRVRPMPPAPPPAAPGTAAGWQPDPTGRAETRFWDGSGWTESVFLKGRMWSDTPWLPPVAKRPGVDKPGEVDGRPVAEHSAEVVALLVSGRGVDALILAYRCMDATENALRFEGTPVVVGCYQAAAAIHAERGELDQVEAVRDRLANQGGDPDLIP